MKKIIIRIFGLIIIALITMIIISPRSFHESFAKAEGVVNCGPSGSGCKVTFISGGDTVQKGIKGYMERPE